MEDVCVVGEGTAIINASTTASELGTFNNREQSGPQPEKISFCFIVHFIIYHDILFIWVLFSSKGKSPSTEVNSLYAG